MTGELIERVRHLYNHNDVVKAIFNEFANNYTRNMSATSVANISYRIKKTDSQVKDAFRECEALKLGRYVPGRWNSPSRFEWVYKIKELGAVARGAKDSFDEGPFTLDDEPIESPSNSASTTKPTTTNGIKGDLGNPSVNVGLDTIGHRFTLRAGCEVEIRLPADLTSTEAARLARFVTSLPFNAEVDD